MALFSLEEYEGAKEAFDRTAVLEPTKRIHRDWVRMCQGKLGGEAGAWAHAGQAHCPGLGTHCRRELTLARAG